MRRRTRQSNERLSWVAVVGLFACGDAVVTPSAGGVQSAGGAEKPPIAGVFAAGTVAAPTPTVASTSQSGAASVPPLAASGVPVGGAAGVAGTVVVAAGSAAVGSGVTYHKDLRPIIEARCLGCHVEGGSGPFPLDQWDKVEPYKGLVVHAVELRRMPPWLADASDCTKLRDDQRLSDEQVALFSSWQASGFAVGDEADFKSIPSRARPAIGEPNLIIKAAQPHKLNPGQEYYACLQVDTRVTEELWVTAMDLVPENAEFVHHAIVSVGGGSCSALGTTAENIYSYRPGSQTLVFEKGDALRIAAGSVIAIQYHYNTKFAPRGMTLPTDHSAFRLWTLPAGQKPERAIVRMPHHDLLINIPVNAVDQMEGGSQAISSEYTRPGAEIIGISPHMHYLGQTFKETVRKSDGSTVCLIDIPAWDQDWQLDYLYDPAHYIPIADGGRVTQECMFSNRAEDQGIGPDGKPFTPMYTTFGEDTRQEMCLGYIWFRYPLSGAL